jgi:hypothetical protein
VIDISINMYDHQVLAIEKLKNGSILCGGVGTGKSRTALGYYYFKECKGELPVNDSTEIKSMEDPKDLYIITTARKRDTLEWEHECVPFLLYPDQPNEGGVKMFVDSWNNIGKYTDVENAFFIFDEQRVVGSGAWVKAFLKITKSNRWILLSATPGDTWSDYIPVFIANGFYKNRTDFNRQHVIYNRYAKFPKVDRYINIGKLIKCRNQVVVNMKYIKPTMQHHETVIVGYDKYYYDLVSKKRWHVYENRPIKDASELCYTMRKVVNTDQERIDKVKEIIKDHSKIIIFYNFDYELELLRQVAEDLHISLGEWNGHKHQPIPNTDSWIYLVQYTAGSEGWNCTKTDTILFYSQSYSYKATVQAAGRIDRLNTSYSDLYYYHLRSNSQIDVAIAKTLHKKKSFNESIFVNEEVFK